MCYVLTSNLLIVTCRKLSFLCSDSNPVWRAFLWGTLLLYQNLCETGNIWQLACLSCMFSFQFRCIIKYLKFFGIFCYFQLVVNVVKCGGCQLISLRWWWFFPVWSIDADNYLFAKPNLMQVVCVLVIIIATIITEMCSLIDIQTKFDWWLCMSHKCTCLPTLPTTEVYIDILILCEDKPHSLSQTASRSVQPFLHGSWHNIPLPNIPSH